MLSNTATPKYYGQFREAVLRSEIPVCETISMEMNRIDGLIANSNIYYDPEPVERFIRFCENELTLVDGSDMHMLDSFKLWAEQVYGWWYFVRRSVFVPGENGREGRYENRVIKKRLVNKQYLIVGRGAAKTLYDSDNQAYFLSCDTATTEQVTTAPTMRQAEEVLFPIKTALARAKGPLFKFLTEGSLQNTTGSKVNRVKMTPTKNGIENFVTQSVLKVLPMSIDKLQGLRAAITTLDEWLSCEIREDPVGAIEQGASKNDDWLIIATSSEGTIRNGCGDSIKMELMSILKGEYYNPHVSIWYYRLDDIKEVGMPEMWIKANPNLGKTVTYETYQLDVERAEKAPGARNDILAKRFGIPMEGYTYFFTYQETLPPVKGTLDFWKMQCSMGIDMSRGDDFCAFTFLFPLKDGRFGIKTKCYITSVTLNKLPRALREKYEHFMEEGSLTIMDTTVLKPLDLYDDVEKYILDNGYTVESVGFDPYYAREFVEKWISENGQWGVEKVVQGKKTESVPLGEIKTLAGEKMLIFDQSIMTFAMGNAIALEDSNGNRMLSKRRADEKIDCVSALLDAYIAYKLHQESFE